MIVEAMDGTEIGSLTEMDAILGRLWLEGHDPLSIRAGAASVLNLVHLAEACDSIIRVKALGPLGDAPTSVAISGYKHPVTGDIVPIQSLLGGDGRRIEFHVEGD